MASTVRINKRKKAAVFTCSSDLTINSVAENRTLLLETFEKVDRLELDLKKVESVDSAALQLFCSAHRYAVRESKEFLLKKPLPDLVESFMEDAGFLRHVGCAEGDSSLCLWMEDCDE